jgi:CubicO group peptidase (beta-lactamase class C family)
MLCAASLAQAQTTAGVPVRPVSSAIAGFTPDQATDLLGRFNNEEALKGGDVSLFGFLNFSEVQKVALVARDGQVMPLETAPDPAIGQVSVGGATLEAHLADPASRAQGVVVVHDGRIVYEAYPGMRPNDYHIWMSTTKTVASLMLRLLVEDGLVDVNAPIETYLPEFAGTEWTGVTVQDALDMKSGMDVIESNETRADPDSTYTRMNLSGSGVPHDGEVESMSDVLRSAKRLRPPGEAFDYGSPLTLILPLIVERVTGQRWSDLFEERVWSKMGVEGDMLMGVTPQGLALVQGVAITRLRDLARYGMLYTPSWDKAARERLVSEDYVATLSAGGDPDIYLKGGTGPHMVETFAGAGAPPVSNTWQWDAVFEDGDFYKSGFLGQGLYVSPATDTVVVFFSTNYNQLPAFARAIALHYGGAQ